MAADFDFEAWRAEQAQQRRARREELRNALAGGLAVWQAGTLWTTAGCVSIRLGAPRAFAAFVDCLQEDGVNLANHLENREYGFGFPTEIVRAASYGRPEREVQR